MSYTSSKELKKRAKEVLNLRKTRKHRKRLENKLVRQGDLRAYAKEFAHHFYRWNSARVTEWLKSMGYEPIQPTRRPSPEGGLSSSIQPLTEPVGLSMWSSSVSSQGIRNALHVL